MEADVLTVTPRVAPVGDVVTTVGGDAGAFSLLPVYAKYETRHEIAA